jgi:hypothetical protein
MRELNHKAVCSRGLIARLEFVTAVFPVKLKGEGADDPRTVSSNLSDQRNAWEFDMKGSALVLASLLATSVPVQADVLLLDSIQSAPPNSAAGVMRPRGGESMSSVRAGFGEPGTIQPAIGEPPITRWVYPDYTVYFEFDRVIEVVVHR